MCTLAFWLEEVQKKTGTGPLRLPATSHLADPMVKMLRIPWLRCYWDYPAGSERLYYGCATEYKVVFVSHDLDRALSLASLAEAA